MHPTIDELIDALMPPKVYGLRPQLCTYSVCAAKGGRQNENHIVRTRVNEGHHWPTGAERYRVAAERPMADHTFQYIVTEDCKYCTYSMPTACLQPAYSLQCRKREKRAAYNVHDDKNNHPFHSNHPRIPGPYISQADVTSEQRILNYVAGLIRSDSWNVRFTGDEVMYVLGPSRKVDTCDEPRRNGIRISDNVSGRKKRMDDWKKKKTGVTFPHSPVPPSGVATQITSADWADG